MLTKITEPETFEQDGKPFTKQVFMRGTTTINLVRPVLTPEEYEARRMEVEKAAIDLLKSTMEKEKTASVPDGSSTRKHRIKNGIIENQTPLLL